MPNPLSIDLLQSGCSYLFSAEALGHQLILVALLVLTYQRSIKQTGLTLLSFTAGLTFTYYLSVEDVLQFAPAWIRFFIPCTLLIAILLPLSQKAHSPRKGDFSYYLSFLVGLFHGLSFAEKAKTLMAPSAGKVKEVLSYHLGLELGILGWSVLILGGMSLIRYLFRIRYRDWALFISGAIASLAFHMFYQYWPFP